MWRLWQLFDPRVGSQKLSPPVSQNLSPPPHSAHASPLGLLSTFE